jgi:hypothetical protein
MPSFVTLKESNMSWKVWKQPIEKAQEEFENGYKKGLNLSDWASAYSHFETAFGFYNQVGDQTKTKVAKTLVALSKAPWDPERHENWTGSSRSAQNSLKCSTTCQKQAHTSLIAPRKERK